MTDRFAVITINDGYNYGNRLQNYALVSLLSRYGDAFTIFTRCDDESRPGLSNNLLLHFQLLKRAVRLLVPLKRPAALREVRFSSFTKDFVPDDCLYLDTSSTLESSRLGLLSKVVVGSDQVWNYTFGLTDEGLALRLGSAVPPESLVSYAASFGLSSIDEHHAKIFRRFLPRFSAISVREFRAAEIVRELTELDAEVVLDPTLMLDADEWRVLEPGFVPGGERYVLTYFLGEPSLVQEAFIQAEASRRGCGVRRILDSRDLSTLSAGPREFVELFDRAECVFTDSFHACCFSILFHRPFKVFDRKGMSGELSMNSRMDTLFRLFELDADTSDGPLPEIDWARVDSLLEGHRARSRAWLERALGVAGEGARG